MTDHLECHKLLGSLSDFVDGSIAADLCDEINRHMSECENCRVVVNTLRKTVELYHEETPTDQLPEDIRQRLFMCLDLNEFFK